MITGKESKKFRIHAGVLKKSDLLRASLEGGWKEGLKRKLSWEDWESDTVERLVQWLYSGDYTCPLPTLIDQPEGDGIETSSQNGHNRGNSSNSRPSWNWDREPSPEESTAFEVSESFLESSTLEASVSLMSRPLPPVEDDLIEISPQITQAQEYEAWFEEHKGSLSQLDFEVTFLAHAKLYVFADYLILPTLRELSLQRLRETLILLGKLSASNPSTEDFVRLLDYVYAKTQPVAAGEEPMRKLVSSFAAFNLPALHGDLFTQLAAQGGDLIIDLITKTSRRLMSLEHPVDDWGFGLKSVKKNKKAKKSRFAKGDI